MKVLTRFMTSHPEIIVKMQAEPAGIPGYIEITMCYDLAPRAYYGQIYRIEAIEDPSFLDKTLDTMYEELRRFIDDESWRYRKAGR